jgi:hypothetical protein
MIGCVDLSWISDHLASLEGVREQAEGSRTTWRAQGRLVARLEDGETLLVRASLADRERLAARLPDAFYVTPAIEAHHKVLVHLPLADPDDVRRVLTAAWEMQRDA